VKFENTSVGAFDSLRWYFGDGFTDTGQTPIHAYTSIGVYTCTLAAYGPCGSDMLIQEDLIRLCDTLLAENVLIQIDTLSGEGLVNSTFEFTDVSTEGIVTNRTWYLDGSILASNVTQVQAIIGVEGTHWIRLTQTNSCGVATDSVELVVPIP
jgi:hypothetical protein